MADEYPEGRRWEFRAREHIHTLDRAGLLEPRDAGYTDSLLAAGIAMDLAEKSEVSGQVEYARRGWSAALQHLTPPPAMRPHKASGVNDADAESEFDRLARAFYDGAPERDAEFPNPA